MNIGNAIKAIRKRQKIKQGVFAGICGITPAYLSLIESGQKQPAMTTLLEIAKYLNISPATLIFEALEDADIKPGMLPIWQSIQPLLKELLP